MHPHHPRPSLLRSPILWIGLAVMVFLGWAWLDSVKRWTYVWVGMVGIQSQASGVMCWFVPKASGGLDFDVSRPSSPWLPDEFGRFHEMTELRLGRPEIWRPLEEGEVMTFRVTGLLPGGRRPDAVMAMEYHGSEPTDGDSGVQMAFIPYWCLMLVALLPWLGLIYWRHRRIHRLPAAASPEPESTP